MRASGGFNAVARSHNMHQRKAAVRFNESLRACYAGFLRQRMGQKFGVDVAFGGKDRRGKQAVPRAGMCRIASAWQRKCA